MAIPTRRKNEKPTELYTKVQNKVNKYSTKSDEEIVKHICIQMSFLDKIMLTNKICINWKTYHESAVRNAFPALKNEMGV